MSEFVDNTKLFLDMAQGQASVNVVVTFMFFKSRVISSAAV